ncbi:AAA family ATPase [bacterium]|nr:AAA family ATPase [bacterium]
MENINLDDLLDRNNVKNQIIDELNKFQLNKSNKLQKRGIYIYGEPGSGKSKFVENILNELNYDIVKYDAGDIRNKCIIENITKQNMSDYNVLSLFNVNPKNIAILMDEIDGMNNGDKGGINALIKLIRPKKTKKQKLEEVSNNPIICISNYHFDKKIKELMKMCILVEIKKPTSDQIIKLINTLIPNLDTENLLLIKEYVNSDLRKLNELVTLNSKYMNLLKNDVLKNIFKSKMNNEDTKQITRRLLNKKVYINEHLHTINETDRTIVGLLWHENIIDCLSKLPPEKALPFYHKALLNICFADFIDRITFQKQIWQFNEMSSLLKTFNNNKLYHDEFKESIPNYNPGEVRFTKVLTKYSTEYNNNIFIQKICQILGLDKKDVFSHFLVLRENHDKEEIYEMFDQYEIQKLDIERIYRYIDKYTDLNTCKEI